MWATLSCGCAAQVKSESDPADAVAGCKALASMLEILAVFRTPVERAQIGQLLIQVHWSSGH
jgi:hypothetical protein